RNSAAGRPLQGQTPGPRPRKGARSAPGTDRIVPAKVRRTARPRAGEGPCPATRQSGSDPSAVRGPRAHGTAGRGRDRRAPPDTVEEIQGRRRVRKRGAVKGQEAPPASGTGARLGIRPWRTRRLRGDPERGNGRSAMVRS